MDKLEYQVYNHAGTLVLQSSESCRYSQSLEMAMLNAGYTIKLDGKRLTKAEVKKREEAVEHV